MTVCNGPGCGQRCSLSGSLRDMNSRTGVEEDITLFFLLKQLVMPRCCPLKFFKLIFLHMSPKETVVTFENFQKSTFRRNGFFSCCDNQFARTIVFEQDMSCHPGVPCRATSCR